MYMPFDLRYSVGSTLISSQSDASCPRRTTQNITCERACANMFNIKIVRVVPSAPETGKNLELEHKPQRKTKNGKIHTQQHATRQLAIRTRGTHSSIIGLFGIFRISSGLGCSWHHKSEMVVVRTFITKRFLFYSIFFLSAHVLSTIYLFLTSHRDAELYLPAPIPSWHAHIVSCTSRPQPQ